MPPSFRRFPAGSRGLVCAALALALLTGCGTESRPPVRNHAAKQAYLITLEIENPPAPVTAVEGHASYQVMNDSDCVPRRPFFGGPAGVWFATEPVQFRPIGPNRWQAEVYADLYLDQKQTEDLAVCDWEFIGTGGDFTLGGVTFYTSLSKQEVLRGASREEHFKRRWLANPPPAGARLGPEIGKVEDPAAVFRTTITSKELTR